MLMILQEIMSNISRLFFNTSLHNGRMKRNAKLEDTNSIFQDLFKFFRCKDHLSKNAPSSDVNQLLGIVQSMEEINPKPDSMVMFSACMFEDPSTLLVGNRSHLVVSLR